MGFAYLLRDSGCSKVYFRCDAAGPVDGKRREIVGFRDPGVTYFPGGQHVGVTGSCRAVFKALM